LVFHRQYPRWRQHGIEVHATVDHAQDDWQGHVGVVTDLLKRLPLEDPQATVLMTCGPEIMMRLTAQTAVELGVPAAQVHVTLERSMRCAFGLCGHCQFGPAFVCKDGPVFSYDRVAPLLEVDSL
jgi:NAD(P)H-flavin reductase